MTSWPTLPQSNVSASDPEPVSERSGAYYVICEEANGNSDYRWWISYVSERAYPTRETARQAAESAAKDFHPQNPMMEQSRRIFRQTPDSYIVSVQGAVSEWHFRVTVGELL